MICEKHSWWLDTPCPQCTKAPAAGYSGGADIWPPITPDMEQVPLPELVHDPEVIPTFLQRNRDNSLRYPGPLDPTRSAELRKAEYAADEQEPRELSCLERQGWFREQHQLADREKARLRIEKLKAQQEAS